MSNYSVPTNLTVFNANPIPCPTGSSCGCPSTQPTCAFDRSALPQPERRCMNMSGPYIPFMHNNFGGVCEGDRNCGTSQTCVDGRCKTSYSTFPMMG